MTETGEKKKGFLRRRWKTLLGIFLLLLLILYIVFVNLLVSAALVPSFMKKLDAFQEVTEQSVAKQVHTTALQENHKAAMAETRQWLEETELIKKTMTSRDGYRLVAAEFLSEDPDAPWVVLLHGYTGWKEEMYPFACRYHRQGFNVLVPDLRCQGESDGDFIGMGWTDRVDVRDWMEQEILSRHPDAEIVLHGQSMGGACALMLSGMEDLPENVRCIVSDCGYTDAYSMFRQDIRDWFGLPAFPLVDSANLMLQIRGGYDLKKASAVEAVKKSHVPTLIIHGDKDAMVPVEMAYEIYDAAQAEKELLIVEGAGHAQAQDQDPETYYSTLQAFLDRYLAA